MTRVFYGGPPTGDGRDGIELKIIDTVLYSHQVIYDGPTRLYDEVTYECVAVANPRAMSYVVAGIGGDPKQQDGFLPPVTLNAIRHRLLAPQRKLLITSGNEILVRSPEPGYGLDAANGPQPYRCDVVYLYGLKTFGVRWGVRTWINPCHKETGDSAVILSHRWRAERTVDQDGYSTRIVHGHAIFDTGRLQKVKARPDDYFDSLVHPIDNNFRRASIQTVATEDDRECEYVVVDREMPINMYSVGIARAEIVHTATINRPGIKEIVGSAIEGGRKGARGGKGSSKFGMVSGGVGASIPMETHDISCRLWGNTFANKVFLEDWGKRVCADLLTKSSVGLVARNTAGLTTSITRDVTGKFVELNAQMRVPIIFRNPLPSSQLRWPDTPRTDEVDYLLFDTGGNNPPLPGGNTAIGGTRGTWLGTVVAQALARPCAKQPAPPDANKEVKMATDNTKYPGLPM